MISKKMRQKLVDEDHSITLLYMKSSITKNSKPHHIIPICTHNGEKDIAYDFYKHITTIKK